MAFEDLQAEIAELFRDMTEQPQDAHELAQQIRDMLNQMKATGMPLPQDLVELEARLVADFGEGSAAPVDLDSTEARGEPAEGDGTDPLLDSPGAPPL
jgi:hypothetical protein